MKKAYATPMIQLVTLNPEETLATDCISKDIMSLRRIGETDIYANLAAGSRSSRQLVITKGTSNHSFRFYANSSGGATGSY